MPTPDEVVQKLNERLALSAEQKAQIKPIIADRQQRIEALQTNTTDQQNVKARKVKNILKDSDSRIKDLLNDDQKQKYAALERQTRDEMRQRAQQQTQPR
jgi:hypothetical protein